MNAATDWADLSIHDPAGNLYLVADSHLDHQDAPHREFIDMLNMLPEPHTVVFLGDLFKIWLAPPKFWTDSHRQVMEAFGRLRDRGCRVVLIAGNREMLLPKELTGVWREWLPFTHFSHGEWKLEWYGLRCGFIHGDTINTKDLKYLRWRAFSHSALFEALFHAMPGHLARWIAQRVEILLAQTNREYKIAFPEDEIRSFAETRLAHVDHYFVGHFHLDREIHVDAYPGKLRLTPDWLSQRAVLRLDPGGSLATLHFQEGRLVE